ncbi:helix-turn-helix transcriptional regulator [Micromonospora sp. NPDC023888]|uniref:helix-turn-helix domain-containing protein n=1 Tax=Micromonospora sp. NPDC023888 TaxID=3155607 RepID=UPI0033CB523F
MTTRTRPGRAVGELLRDWRRTRGLSQLDLSIEAGVSARHLSFVETGRSRPSPDLIMRLTERLDMPLAERNLVLLAGGYAPAYSSHELSDPELAPLRAALRQILDGHSPYPAVLVDRHWRLVEANPAVALFTAGAEPHLLTPPVNVLRLSLHPGGMASRISNLPEWRAHLLARLRQQAATTDDPALRDLLQELRGYPGGGDVAAPTSEGASRVVIPLRYRHGERELCFISTTTLFGTPLDVTVAGLAVEAFFPADPVTTAALHALTPAAHPR